MTDKKVIKLNFCDFWKGYNKENNWFVNVLRKNYDIEISENPDFLFYSCFGIEHLEYQDCVKIFFTGENVIPNFNECDYAFGFDYIECGDRYFHKPIWVHRKAFNASDEDMVNRRFCNFIYSNTTAGKGSLLRQEFCKKLMEYKHVDCPGRVLNNMYAEDLEPRNGNWAKSKREFLKKYKFTIAFENSSSNGYTTEKLLDPLESFSIPIYWGNPLVAKEFNPKAFINCNDYDNDFDAVIERVKELDNDASKYLAMLHENPMQPNFDYEQGKKQEQWLISIIEKGNKPFDKDPLNFSTAAILRTKLRQLEETLLKDKNEGTTARIDVSCAYEDNAFNIGELKPVDWMKNSQQFGYVLQYNGSSMDKQIKINKDTNLKIILRGPDCHNAENKQIQAWVDFTSLLINGNEILSQIVSVWHNKPFIYALDAKKGDVINLHAEWEKHEISKNDKG